MDAEALLAREESEQRVIEAKIKERRQQQQQQEASTSTPNTPPNSTTSSTGGFGSSLEQNERIQLLRARSSSVSEGDAAVHAENINEETLRNNFSLTPEERQMLEDEMRSQCSHPLALRLEAEAEERRLQNEQEYYRNNPTALLRNTAGRYSTGSSRRNNNRRNWNQIVEAFERGGHGEVNSLDDLVVLEAAMILSMEEEARRRGGGGGGSNQPETATAATARQRAGDDMNDLDVERHAEQGFPLVRSILSRRQGQGLGQGRAAGSDNILENDEAYEMLQSLARRRGRNNPLLRASTGNANGTNTQLGAALGLQMRGMSEEDQLAMAIAASLQEQQPSQQQGEDGEEGQQEREQEREEQLEQEGEEGPGEKANNNSSDGEAAEEDTTEEANNNSSDGNATEEDTTADLVGHSSSEQPQQQEEEEEEEEAQSGVEEEQEQQEPPSNDEEESEAASPVEQGQHQEQERKTTGAEVTAVQ